MNVIAICQGNTVRFIQSFQCSDIFRGYVRTLKYKGNLDQEVRKMGQNIQTWLICGGRDFADTRLFGDVMRRLTAERGCPAEIIHGGSKGADTMADNWARDMELDCVRVPAKWATFGKKAGPLRNKKMMQVYTPDLVVAFPGGRGTADMVSRARAAGVEIVAIT